VETAPGATAAGRDRRHYTLADKLAIVRESQQPGVSQASISRKHNLGKNVLWTWRKSFAGLADFAFNALDAPQPARQDAHEVEDLRHKIAELERLLGQKAFEIEMLRGRLQAGMRSAGCGMSLVMDAAGGMPGKVIAGEALRGADGAREPPQHGESLWKQA